MKLLNFGSINIDHVYRLHHLVREGETLGAIAYEKSEGGKGLNQSVALAKAGLDVYHAGTIGKDGLFLIEFLQSFGVRTDYIKVLDAPTGHAMIQVDDMGQNAIIVFGGTNGMITRKMMEDVLVNFDAGDFLLLQNEMSGVADLMKMAHERGLTIALNPSPITPELIHFPLSLVDWFILNEIEGKALAGEKEPDRIIDEMLRRYPQSRIVLTLGENGSMYADAGVRIRQDAIPAKVVDSTAAGDTFTGYLLKGVLSDMPIKDALREASYAAAIAVGRPGAGRSIPCRHEMLDKLSE